MRSSVPSLGRLQLRERGREPGGGLVGGQLEQYLDLPSPRHPRQRAAHVCHRVEVVRRLDRGAVRDGRSTHAVDAERAHVVARVVERREIPPSGMDDEAERAEVAPGHLALERAVRRADPPAAADRLGDEEHGVAGDGLPDRRPAGEADRALECGDLPAQRRGEHAVDLRERPVGRRRRAVQPELAGCHQAQDDDDRLVVGQHERRQPEARADPVAAAHSALALDGNAERLERRHVPPHGAWIDLESVGDLAPGRQRPRLEQLEELEQA